MFLIVFLVGIIFFILCKNKLIFFQNVRFISSFYAKWRQKSNLKTSISLYAYIGKNSFFEIVPSLFACNETFRNSLESLLLTCSLSNTESLHWFVNYKICFSIVFFFCLFFYIFLFIVSPCRQHSNTTWQLLWLTL